jgi:Xaa-Pro aminopeptidase
MILFDYDKAVHLMERWGVDLLLPHTLLNAGYLADHWKHDLYTSIGAHTTFDQDEPYQLFVGLPRDRKIDPFITCRRASEEGDMHTWGMWIEDRRVWGLDERPRSLNSPLPPVTGEMYATPYEAVAAALKERGLAGASIGVERRYLGVEGYEKLQRLLPEAQLREVLGLFLELRVVKSEEEVRRMRCAAQATQQALEVTVKTLQPGMTGLDLESLIGAEHYRAGARHEWIHTQIGPQGIDVVGPSPQEIKIGDVVRIDTGCSYRHYRSDFGLMIAVGEPSKELLQIYGAVRPAMDAVLEALRPGVSARQLFEIGNRILEREGFESYLMYFGHGIGRNGHEEPVLAADSKWVLEENMTIAIELVTVRPALGMVALEDIVVITSDGHEDLSTIGRELHIVEA